ncbi:MAG: RagB/SusD family nutrient uptake outer membrane protein [Muribaculum sp.]|nr:RagB/SusD family nutrient uptake outer membrane protein [Muribaculaceae bacterium]MCM1081174.1 RagB/SusD family nutrient uptake outer membrane protein [Muribaculum sp.]
MNTINKILASFTVGAMALGFGSCVDDLDLKPSDPSQITSGDFSKDPRAYMDRVLGDVYMSFAVHGPNNDSQVHDFDGGMSTFQRAIFNLEEVPTDEACWLSASDAPINALSYGPVSAENRAVFGAYSRLMINVALCNDFIQSVNDNIFGLKTDQDLADAQEGVRECKILRSACYFYLINFFGDVPYADEHLGMGKVAPQISRSDAFDRVTKTLEDVVAEYNTNPGKNRYGFVGKDLAQGLLVKFYLNAEVFTGTPRWSDCVRVANELIAAHKGAGFNGSGLANHYLQNFAANNDELAVGGANAVSEILWTIPEEYPNLKSFGGATLMLLGWINSDMATNYFNAGNGWRCIVAREQFSRKMAWDDSNCKTSSDERLANWKTAADGFAIDNPTLDQADYESNGYLAVKLRNYNMDDAGNYDLSYRPPFSGDDYVSCDWPMLRLAEIYLSAAEAMLHGAGSTNDALTYVNLIRQRAGLQPWQQHDLTLESLQDERCRELYTECTRRTDLIRYGKWCSGYTWNWKNNVASGADYPDYFKLYAIPPEVISQAGYKQNYGY